MDFGGKSLDVIPVNTVVFTFALDETDGGVEGVIAEFRVSR
jgi:hypothetical protein